MRKMKLKTRTILRWGMLPVLGFQLLIILGACSSNQNDFDASGNFEAVETIIPAEANGIIKSLTVQEGQTLKSGQVVGYVDSLQLYLKKKQLQAQIEAKLGGKPDIPVQLSVLQEQLKNAKAEKKRIENLLKGGAATTKQLDDIQTGIAQLNKKIAAQKSALTISTEGINKGIVPLRIQIAMVEDHLQKCKIINPMKGTVLVKYAEENEMAGVGKPLYTIANLSPILLRVYITENQLAKIHLNQKVNVFTDDGKGGFHKTEGNITWISTKAEFTPKTIQTKEERADKVYAVKVRVKNTKGAYKIGMYGEIKF